MAALPTASQVTGVANTLLRQAGIQRTVHGIEQCGSVFFSQLYQALAGARPPGGGGGSEAERCQAVVDAFSEQLAPHVSLEHIRGVDLAARDPLTILHLLDIFSVLFHLPSVRKRDTKPLTATTGEEDGTTYHCLTLSPSSAGLTTHLHHPHLSPTLTTLTSSTIDQSDSTPPPGGSIMVPPTREQLGSTEGHETPPQTPPPSQKQLLNSPLHHSTPRAPPTRSRLHPPHTSVISFPLATTTACQLPSPPLSSDEEQGGAVTTPSCSRDLETPNSIPDPETRNGTESNNDTRSDLGVHQEGADEVRSPQPPGPQEGVNREVLLQSLCQSYLREMEAAGALDKRKERVKPAGKREGVKPAGRREGVKPAGKREGVKPAGRKEGVKPAGRREGVKPPGRHYGKVGVTSDLFPVVEASLPVCHVSMETIQNLWRKQLHQITRLTKPIPSHHHRTDQQIEAMSRKHTALLESIRKEIDHTRRLREREESLAQQRAVQTQLRSKRQATARARRYFRDYELDLKKKLQRKRTKEEEVFRRVFEDGLALVREREREVRSLERERREGQRERLRKELEAMEQYYSDQLSMLAESLVEQRNKSAVRAKAKTQLSRQLGREMRERLESEVKQLQGCLDKDDDVAHFRELDAQQLRLALHHLLTPSL